MAGQDTLSFDEALKTVYEHRIVDLLPRTVPLLQKAEEKDGRGWEGRHIEYDLRVRRNAGVGAYSEMGAMPAAGRQSYATVRIPMRYISGRIQLSAQVIEASKSSRGAFTPALQSEMDGLIQDLKHETARMIVGDGRGVLALCNGDPTSSATVTVDAPGGVAGATNGARFIPLEGFVAMINPSGGAMRASSPQQVLSLPSGNLTYTISGTAPNANVADNDYIVRAANGSITDVSDTSYNKEPMGILGLVDDGTYVATLHNVNRTTYPAYASHVITVNGAIGADVIQRGLDVVEQRSGTVVDEFWCHQSVRRAYITLTEDGRRYMGSDLSRPDAGTAAAKQQPLSFGGIPLKTDRFLPYGMLFGMNWDGFEQWFQEKGRWMRSGHDEGSVLQQLGTGSTLQHGYEAVYYRWINFHHTNPNRCVRFDGITATVVSLHAD